MAMPMESRSQIWRRIEEGEALEKDIPSLPSLPAIDISGLEESFQDPSRSSFSVTAAHRSLSRRSRPLSQSPSISSKDASNSIHVVDNHFGTSLSLHSDEMMINEEELGPLVGDGDTNHSKSFWRGDAAPDFDDAVESQSSSEQPACEDGGSPQFVDVDIGEGTEHDRSPRVDESFVDTLPPLDFKNIVTRRNTDHSRPPALTRSVSSLGSSSSSSSSRANLRRSTAHEHPEVSGSQRERDPSISQSEAAMSSDVSEHQAQLTVSNVERDSREPTFSSSEGSQFGEDNTGRNHTPELSTPMPGSSMTRQTEDEAQQSDQDVMATPLPRKRAFLMGVINSTARPRQRFQTPHSQTSLPGPRFANNIGPVTPLHQTPLPSKFGGRRLSHPLVQVHTFEPSTPSDARSPDSNGMHASPGDASFVSTASSQDLTLQRRANASFDPLMGQEVYNRFNVQKLANYQQGLIKRLQDEAASLSEQVKYLLEDNEALRNGQGESSQNRTHVRGDLSGVREEQDAEAWLAEKEKFESAIQELENQRDGLQERLEVEQEERSRDKDRWKERMAEVEQGVGNIVRDLEARLNAAEAKSVGLAECERKLGESEEKLAKASVECREWRTRAESSDAEPGQRDEDGPALLKSLRKKNSQLISEVDTLAVSLKQREERIKALECSLEAGQKDATMRRAEEKESLDVARRDLATAQASSQRLRDKLQGVERELSEAVASVQRAEANAKASEEQAAELREALVHAKESLQRMKERDDSLKRDVCLARDQIKELEQALETAEEKFESNGLEIADLRTKLGTGAGAKSLTSTLEGNLTVLNEMEEELDKANKEIGRLNGLLNQSPARKAIGKAKDARIDMLEKQNEDLLRQIVRLEEIRVDADIDATTPRKPFNSSGISPMHRHLLSMATRTPRTPGEPLTDPSWLYDKTGEIYPTPLLAEISSLQKQLDIANESIDDKLDKLEEAGLGVTDLTKALDEARSRIANLEVQLMHLTGDGNAKRQCAECSTKARLGKSRDELCSRVKKLTSELENLRQMREAERLTFKGENAVLKDAAHRLNSEIATTKWELKLAVEQGQSAERNKAEIQEALGNANKMVQELEQTLETDRNLLKSMKVDHAQATRDRDKILAKLRKTEMEVDEAKDHLQQLKSENSRLTAAFRDQDNTEALQEKLSANRCFIDRLRTERSELTSERLHLQEQLAEASKHVNNLNSEQVKLQASYNGRRKQIDVQAKEMEDLRSALCTQGTLLNRLASERDRAEIESKDVQKVIRGLEADLRRVQKDADKLGEDLNRLRQQKNEMEARYDEGRAQHERNLKQSRAQVRLLREQLETQKLLQHSNGDASMDDLKLIHKKECKGLFVQIRYLKAKFTREAALRADLGYQKQYLLIVLSQLETSEKRILATLAQVGSPIHEKRKFKSLRVYGMLVIFLLRTSRASEIWREQRSSKEAIVLALEQVRKGRETKTAS